MMTKCATYSITNNGTTFFGKGKDIKSAERNCWQNIADDLACKMMGSAIKDGKEGK